MTCEKLFDLNCPGVGYNLFCQTLEPETISYIEVTLFILVSPDDHIHSLTITNADMVYSFIVIC